MKQQPTIKEWQELEIYERAEFWRSLGVEVANPNVFKYKNGIKLNRVWIEYRAVADKIPTIGEMIWFLGDYWYTVLTKYDGSIELADWIYKAVKKKLNKKICT